MKQIPLTQGKFALVDDEDYDWLTQWRWGYSNGYAIRGLDSGKTKIWMHRVINKTPDGLDTDHIDSNKLNNQKSNLRSATKSQNMMNRKSFKNSTSKYKGVCWNKRAKKWFTSIRIEKNFKWIGSFLSETEAAKAYNVAAIQYFGEFAQLNIIENENLTNVTECHTLKG